MREADAIRRWTDRFGNRVGLLTRWRADVVGCRAESECAFDGFDASWLHRVPSDHVVASDLGAWRRAGYSFRPSRSLSTEWWSDIRGALDDGEHYVPYARIDTDGKRITVRKLAADLCNADYRAWAVDHAAWQVSQVGADGIVMANKWVFWPAPQVWHDNPAEIRIGGGVITHTPYAPGEYERCFSELIRALHRRGVRVALNTNGLPRAQAWRWMPEDLPPLVLGETRSASFRHLDVGHVHTEPGDVLPADPVDPESGVR